MHEELNCIKVERNNRKDKTSIQAAMSVRRSFPGAIVVKFHVTNSKLREKYFSTTRLIGKCEILKSRRPRLLSLPLPTPCFMEINLFCDSSSEK